MGCVALVGTRMSNHFLKATKIHFGWLGEARYSHCEVRDRQEVPATFTFPTAKTWTQNMAVMSWWRLKSAPGILPVPLYFFSASLISLSPNRRRRIKIRSCCRVNRVCQLPKVTAFQTTALEFLHWLTEVSQPSP